MRPLATGRLRHVAKKAALGADVLDFAEERWRGVERIRIWGDVPFPGELIEPIPAFKRRLTPRASERQQRVWNTMKAKIHGDGVAMTRWRPRERGPQIVDLCCHALDKLHRSTLSVVIAHCEKDKFVFSDNSSIPLAAVDFAVESWHGPDRFLALHCVPDLDLLLEDFWYILDHLKTMLLGKESTHAN